MDVSYDGRYAFTAGGQDRSVVQWEINLRYVMRREAWPHKKGVKWRPLLFTQEQQTGIKPLRHARHCARPEGTKTAKTQALPLGCSLRHPLTLMCRQKVTVLSQGPMVFAGEAM